MQTFINKFYRIIESLIIILIIVVLVTFPICATLFVSDVFMLYSHNININEFPESIDYGVLSDEQIETFNNILYAAENSIATIDCRTHSDKEWHEILTHLELYFGYIENIWDLIYLHDDIAYLNLNKFKVLYYNKAIIDARVDEAVCAFRDGSDEYKLWQISNYISKRITYTTGYCDTLSAFDGNGVCMSYAMLFYKMATRIGIESYICYGIANNGHHAWNVIKLDGKLMYYDITWYDSSHNYQYIHSESAWDREFMLNNRWMTDLKEDK